MCIILTAHAIQRGKERLGLKQAALQRTADRAFAEGMRRDECAGNMRRWLDRSMKEHRKGNDTRIYGEAVWIINDGTLITVLDLPHEYRHTVAKWRRQKCAIEAVRDAGGCHESGGGAQARFKRFKRPLKRVSVREEVL